MQPTYQGLIERVSPVGTHGARVPVIDPGSEEVFAEVRWATAEDAALALDTAEQALSGEWLTWSPTQRGRFLTATAAAVRRNAAELALLLTKEQGKPLHQASSAVEDAAALKGAVAGAAGTLAWNAGQSRGQRSRVKGYIRLGIEEGAADNRRRPARWCGRARLFCGTNSFCRLP